MTISSQIRTAGPFTGTGLATSYPFSFKVFQTSDVVVAKTDATGTQTTLTLSTDYTVALNADQNATPGGTVTLLTALPIGYTLNLTSNVQLTQNASLTNAGGFFPRTIEDALDRLTILMQQQGFVGLPQTIRVPEIGGIPALPAAAARASRILGFDLSGNPVATLPAPGDATGLALDLADAVTAGKGAAKVGFRETLGPTAVPYLKTLSDIANAGEVSLHRFLPTANIAAIQAGTSTYDATGDLRAAGLAMTKGGTLLLPYGRIYTASGAMALLDNTTLRGGGNGSEIWTDQDVELITSANLDSVFVASIVLENLMLRSTRTSAQHPTKYQVHLRNALLSRIDRVQVQSGLSDLPGSATDIAGIWLDRKVAGSAGQGSYLNRVTGCFLANAGLLLQTTVNGVTDGFIDRNIIYGHACAHSIKFTGSCGNWLVQGNQLSSPPSNAAIWVNSGTVDHLRILGNFFDGNPGTLTPGHGILSDSGAQRVVVTGNQFWGMGKSGIRAQDPLAWTVSANGFLDNNQLDNFWPDIEIVGVAIQPSKNVVAHNVHQVQSARVNAGYAIKETNGGQDPVQNKISHNMLSGNAAGYATGGILPARTADAQASDLFLNDGFGSEKGNNGTFTPAIAGSTTPGVNTYSASFTTGKWRRVGRKVFIQGEVYMTAKDAAMAGNIRITGFPFVASATEPRGAFTLGLISNVTIGGGGTQWMAWIEAGANFARLGATGSTLAWSDTVAGQISATTSIQFSGYYFID